MSTLVIRRGTAVLGTAGALLLAVLAIAPQANAATIYACVKNKAGTARVFTKKPKCKRGETRLSWNTTGPAGLNGTNGVGGGAGKDGPAGGEGAAGKAGPAGQPQFGAAISASVTAPGSGKSETSLFALAGVTVKLGCAKGVSALEASGPPAGTRAESGMVDSRANNKEPTQIVQQTIYNVALTSTPAVFGALASNASGEAANVGHINATIMTSIGFVIIDTFIETTPTECKLSGTTFDMPG
jgi:hypothetical protein